MSQEGIEFTIKNDGTMEVDMIGFKGQACEEEIKALLDSLGGNLKTTKKDEYYQKEKNQVQQRRF